MTPTSAILELGWPYGVMGSVEHHNPREAGRPGGAGVAVGWRAGGRGAAGGQAGCGEGGWVKGPHGRPGWVTARWGGGVRRAPPRAGRLRSEPAEGDAGTIATPRHTEHTDRRRPQATARRPGSRFQERPRSPARSRLRQANSVNGTSAPPRFFASPPMAPSAPGRQRGTPSTTRDGSCRTAGPAAPAVTAAGRRQQLGWAPKAGRKSSDRTPGVPSAWRRAAVRRRPRRAQATAATGRRRPGRPS